MSFDLVIFDCDGVLVDSEPLATDLLRQAFYEEGLVLTLNEVIAHFVGLSMAEVIIKAEKILGSKFQPNFLQNLQIKTFSAFRQGLKSVTGVKSLIKELQENEIKFCVASSGSYDKMAVTLEVTGLDIFFQKNIFSVSEVARGKPYPDLFLYAAEKMEIEPARSLVIEDSIYGVRAAVSAGIEVMAYSVRGEDKILQRAGGLVVHHMNEVTKHIFS